MTDQSLAEQGQEDDIVDDGAGTGAEIVSGGDEGEPNPAAETAARLLGWKPEAEWKGTPPDGGFVSADEFLGRSTRHQRDLAERVLKQESDLSEIKSTMAQFAEMQRKRADSAYQRALKDIEARERAAVEDGNVQAYEKAKADREDLEPPKAKVEETKPDPTKDPEYQAWASENPWYGEDVKLTIYANQVAEILGGRPNRPKGAAFYKAVEEEVRKEFPDKFGNPRRNAASRVEGGNNTNQRQNGKGWASIPEADRAAGDRFIKQGLFDEPGKELTLEQKRAKYAREYYDQE